MSNKMALDALTAAIEAMESCEEGDYSTGHVCHPSFDSDAIDAAIEQARAAIAALQAEPQPEPVAEIVGTGGTANMPLLQWLSADHSFRAPIGSMLYALPATPPKD